MANLGRKHSDEARARIGRGQRRAVEHRRRAAAVGPQDLARWRRTGVAPRALRPIVDAAALESGEMIEALGGDDRVSPQRRAIVEDAARVGVVLRCVLARFLQREEPDLEAAGKIGTLASARRAALAAVGLERVAREVPDLANYLRQREAENSENGAGEAIDVVPAVEHAPEGDRAGERSGRASGGAQG